MMSNKKLSYHNRILTALILLLLLFFIPFTAITYTTMINSISKTVVTSNEEHLDQIYSNFEEQNANLLKQTYYIYHSSSVKQIILGSETDFSAVSQINELNRFIAAPNPSIYSIGFYVANTKEFFSTVSSDDSLSFVFGQESVKALSPIFRMAQLPDSAGKPRYLMSYVMFDSKMVPGDPGSFVIINQDVNYLLNELRNGSYAESTEADIFLLSKDYGICGESKNLADKDTAQFQEAFYANLQPTADRGSMTLQLDRENYLVSYTALSNDTVHVVILQRESILNLPLKHIQTRSFTLMITGMLIYAVIIYFMSKSLYRPVENLRKHMQESGGFSSYSRNINEFEQFKTVYASFTAMKKKYYLRYMEDQLLTGNSASVAAFAEAFPNHWLPSQKQLLVAQIVIEYPDTSSLSLENDTALDLYAVQNIAEEILGESFCVEVLPMDNTHLAVILGTHESWSALNTKFVMLKKSIDRFFDFSVSVFYSDPVRNPKELRHAYKQTCGTELYVPIVGKGKILSPDSVRENISNPAVSYSQQQLNALTVALTNRSKENIHKVLQSVCEETKKLSIQNLWICISLLINHIRTVCRELAATTAQTAGLMDQLTRIMNEFSTVDAFFEALEKIAVTAACEDLRESSDKNTVFLRNIEAYIADHHQDSQLSPQQIADHFDVSANYLPRKFQLLSGTSLNSYILQVRMQHAAKLLLENKLPISEITLQVGIENESYFYKLFKKYYGCTPKEFKSRQKGM